MWSFISLVLTLSVVGVTGGVEEQADSVLDFVETRSLEIWTGPQTVLDSEGYLWLAVKLEADKYVYRFNPRGQIVLDRLLEGERTEEYHGWTFRDRMITDRWGNLYFPVVSFQSCITFPNPIPQKELNSMESDTIEMHLLEDRESQLVTCLDGSNPPSNNHLIKITPDGEFTDFHPWPQMDLTQTHIDILDGDTLCMIGVNDSYGTSSRDFRVSKALVDSTGLSPVFDKVYPRENCHIYTAGIFDDYFRYLYDWEKGLGFNAILTWTEDDFKVRNMLEIIRFDLKGQDNGIPGDELAPCNWRDYIWRTYEDAWIGWITFVPYKEGGYLLCIPDDMDRSITHIVRLNNLGEPIKPSVFDGGKKKVQRFDKLPASAKPYVALNIEYEPTFETVERDSAQILFWGCDEEGNLYTYRGARKF